MAQDLVMILAGGKGERLYPLTRDRAKPAVPFGGIYRIIDFALSNFINSGFYRIKVLTQFKSDSLNRHLARGFRLSPELGHYIDPVPAQMRTGESWYKGTADAIFQNLNLVLDEDPTYVMIFGADHIYRMDVRQMLQHHRGKESALTIAAIPRPVEEARSFGVLQVNRDSRVLEFEEKVKNPKEMPDRPGWCLCSMGNYIFDRDVLIDILKRDSGMTTGHDFGKDIIPSMFRTHAVYAYDFSTNRIPGIKEKEMGYWRDVGNIEAYFDANMDLISVSPQLDLYNSDWPLHTCYNQYPPAKFVFANEAEKRVGRATDSLVSEGCIISGGTVSRSILGPGVRINSYSEVSECILMKGVSIGRHAQVRRAIIDSGIEVPTHEKIGFDPEADRKKYFVSPSGIVVIPKPLHHELGD
ncbi:MAG: glucose-1-phosphate adenylyltransferase [Chlamydiota bacterium]